MKKAISLILCITLFIGIMPMSFAARDTSFEETLAEDLKQLGLFYGVSYTDFDLNRAPTRIEALVMLIRVLGSEKEALAGTWKHPFTDVPAWADKYVGYGYEHGLANGVGLTTFGTGRANAAMYLTFVLRALGYSDAYGEFTWDNPFDLAEQVGILTNGVDRANFWRADVVLVSYAALDVIVKGSGRTLADVLISGGVFTRETFNAYYDADAIAKKYPERVSKNSEKIYEDSKDAVFYIEVYDAKGEAYASGSGFFIDSDGTAVTNFHVIEGASSAYIQLASGGVYNVAGIYHYSVENDWAVIDVEGSGFSYLDIGKNDTVVTGSQIYALGSPLGLQDTFSEGIISNTKRVIDGTPYIQLTAPISPGSSGGALLNKYGEVVGITSAYIESGQNLNLAVPLSIVDTTPASYTMSFTEVMKITGMMSDSGSSSSGNTGNAQAGAFNALKEFATVEGDYPPGDYPVYSESYFYENNEIIEYTIKYNTSFNQIYILAEYIQSDGYISETAMVLSEDTSNDSKVEVHYFFGEDMLSAKISFYPEELYYTTGRYFPFDQYFTDYHFSNEGMMWHKETALMMSTYMVQWAGDMLADYSNGKYSMADFGFINLYN